MAMAAVLLDTEINLKDFPRIDACFSYQAAQNESKKNRMGHTSILF
jgi:hypothetical protein